MQTRNRLLDDLSRVASGAMSVATGFKDEAEALLRGRLERILASMDLVRREEFEVLKAMLAKARGEQEALSKRLEQVEKDKAAAKPARSTKAKPAKR